MNVVSPVEREFELDLGHHLAAELIGTAILVLGGPGAAVLAGPEIGLLGVSLAFGLSLLVAALVAGPLHQRQFNPAVTLAFLLARRVPVRQAIYSWVGQLAGGIFGATVVYGIAAGRDGFERGGFASNGWDRDGFSGLGSAIVVEVVFTALLVIVVLTATSWRVPVDASAVVAGLALVLIHLVTMTVDNTGVNPARSLGTAIFADAEPNALGQLWAFIVFPLIGSVIGVFVWLLLDEEAQLEDTLLDTEPLRDTRDTLDDLVD